MINLYQKQLKDKQARVQELTVELESLLEELPKLKTVVEALEALGEQPEVEPSVDEPMSDCLLLNLPLPTWHLHLQSLKLMQPSCWQRLKTLGRN